jgi:hypothetical protein
MYGDERPPVVIGARIRPPWKWFRRHGGIWWQHFLQNEEPDELGSRGRQIVRGDGARRVSNDDRCENANLLHEPRNIITHRLKGVVTHPLAAAMPARVRRKYSEALPKRGRDVPPAPA